MSKIRPRPRFGFCTTSRPPCSPGLVRRGDQQADTGHVIDELHALEIDDDAASAGGDGSQELVSQRHRGHQVHLTGYSDGWQWPARPVGDDRDLETAPSLSFGHLRRPVIESA